MGVGCACHAGHAVLQCLILKPILMPSSAGWLLLLMLMLVKHVAQPRLNMV